MSKFSRRTFLGSTVASALPLPSLGDTQRRRISIRMRDTGPPRAFVNQNGEWDGFVMEVTNELGRRAGFEIDVITDVSWKRALEMTKTGELDLLHSASWREERTDFLDYIGPYDVNLMAIVVQMGTDANAYDTLDAFVGDGKMFGVGRDVALSPEFDTRIKTDPHFASHFQAMMSEVRKPESAQYAGVFRRISEGTITGFILENKGLDTIFANPKDWSISDEILQKIDVIYPASFDRDETYLTASRILDPGVRTAIRASYDNMREDGSFARIWEKWHPGAPEPRANSE